MKCGDAVREYSDQVQELQTDFPELAAAFAPDSLENVLRWMETRQLPPGSIDIIAQDEFSYDFLIRLEPEEKWLVFGVN
jgi:hypothetical protein